MRNTIKISEDHHLLHARLPCGKHKSIAGYMRYEHLTAHQAIEDWIDEAIAYSDDQADMFAHEAKEAMIDEFKKLIKCQRLEDFKSFRSKRVNQFNASVVGWFDLNNKNIWG